MIKMQKTCTQKLQPQKPWPRKMQKNMQSKMQKICNFWKFVFLQNMHSSRICIFSLFFCIFLEFLQYFLNFGALTGGPPKMQKMHNSRICICFAFFRIFFAFCSHFFAFFQFLKTGGPPKNAKVHNSRICIFFCILFCTLFCGRISFAFSDCIFFLLFSSS